jgi:hypothetical protein
MAQEQAPQRGVAVIAHAALAGHLKAGAFVEKRLAIILSSGGGYSR